MSEKTLTVQDQIRIALEAFDEARAVVCCVETGDAECVIQHQSEIALHRAFAESFVEMCNDGGELFLSDN